VGVPPEDTAIKTIRPRPKAPRRGIRPAENGEALETRAFFISRVSTLNVLLKRRAAIYAKRTFGFTLIEWRIITLLPTLQPVSIREFAQQALVDAAQMSRGVSQLEKKGYVVRRRSPVDSREMLVSLTKSGMDLSIEMCRASLERNDQLLMGHSAAEARFLNAALDSLIERARTLLEADTVGEAPAEPEKRRRP
jgi:DNA-binding MarR family transcriptional regulator